MSDGRVGCERGWRRSVRGGEGTGESHVGRGEVQEESGADGIDQEEVWRGRREVAREGWKQAITSTLSNAKNQMRQDGMDGWIEWRRSEVRRIGRSVWREVGEWRGEVEEPQRKRKTGGEEREGDRRVSHDVHERHTPTEMVA